MLDKSTLANRYRQLKQLPPRLVELVANWDAATNYKEQLKAAKAIRALIVRYGSYRTDYLRHTAERSGHPVMPREYPFTGMYDRERLRQVGDLPKVLAAHREVQDRKLKLLYAILDADVPDYEQQQMEAEYEQAVEKTHDAKKQLDTTIAVMHKLAREIEHENTL